MSSRVVLLSLDGGSGGEVEQALRMGGLAVSVVRDAGGVVQRLHEHQLIVLDGPDSAALALVCRLIMDEAGSSHPPILAVAQSRDVEARVELLEAGADDVLALPLDERELGALVEALLFRSNVPHGGQTASAPIAPRPAGAPGRVIAFAAAKGGSGVTTLAVNTALVLAEMAPAGVAIADLDMHHGQVATHLDIYGRSSTASMAREDHAASTPETMNESGRMHPSGLMVFGGPYRPDDADDVTGDQLAGLVGVLRGMYGTVIVDAGNVLDGRTMSVLNEADRVAMIITPDIPSLRLLHAALQVMSEAGTAADRTFFVVNDIYAKPTIGPEQIEEHLGISVGLSVPFDGETFMKAVNEGQPLVSLARRSPPATAIRRLAEVVSDGAVDDESGQQHKRGLFRGLLGRS